MKKFLAPLLALFLLLSALSPLSAMAAETEEGGTPSYAVLIDDSADLLTDAEEQELASKMSELLEYGNMMFTTVTLNDGNFEENCENAYYEKFGNEPGVNFQIDMGNRKITLSASTGMEDMIGGERDSIVDNIYTHATDGDYAACAKECFAEIDAVIHDRKIAHKMKYIDNAIVALLLGLILNFLMVFVTTQVSMRGKRKKAPAISSFILSDVQITKGHFIRRYDPRSSSSGGGGGSSGGGGGGGGFSGGSSSHGF